MRVRINGRGGSARAALMCLGLFLCLWLSLPLVAAAQVTATLETEPVPSGGDAADDPAIWIHPTDPGLSTIIGTDKRGGLAVYALDGTELQYIPAGRLNNVDLR